MHSLSNNDFHPINDFLAIKKELRLTKQVDVLEIYLQRF